VSGGGGSWPTATGTWTGLAGVTAGRSTGMGGRPFSVAGTRSRLDEVMVVFLSNPLQQQVVRFSP
jgi:hypothetical protein